MGRVNRHKRKIALRIRRTKHVKVLRLVERMKSADTKERSRLAEKIRRTAPYHVIPA